MEVKAAIIEIDDLLVKEYGRHRWEAWGDPLSELVLTVLSQHTSDANAARAFEKLTRTFGDWHSVRDAPVEEIAVAIRSAGLGQIKSPRIKGILTEISSRRGNLDLSFLAELPMAEAREWLRSLPGVGPKTAACVLLFSLRKPALPVDTHVHRIALRLGLVDRKASAERTQDELEAMVLPDLIYDFHVNLIAHGRRVCKAQHPRCKGCILAPVCPSCRAS